MAQKPYLSIDFRIIFLSIYKLRATISMFVYVDHPQAAFTCSKSIIERPEECVKSAQS